MSALWGSPAFVIGCLMLVLGVAGVSHIGRLRARRRHLILFTLDELLGNEQRAQRKRETRMEATSRALIATGGVLAFAAYMSF